MSYNKISIVVALFVLFGSPNIQKTSALRVFYIVYYYIPLCITIVSKLEKKNKIECFSRQQMLSYPFKDHNQVYDGQIEQHTINTLVTYVLAIDYLVHLD